MATTFSSRTGGLFGALAGAAILVGCVVQDDPGIPSEGASGSSSSSGGSSTTGAPSTQPMLVEVDANQPLTAAPGAGDGVFVEYTTGGHWNVWWTCDTNQTGLSCQFQNTVTVTTGTIVNVQSHDFEPNDALAQLSAQQIQANTYTTTGIDAMTFDTPFASGQTPVITLEVKLSGQDNGQFIFFVQNGQINGGYKGTLTDPLELEPSAP